jgi:mannose-1-phosphate guanylyltransferase
MRESRPWAAILAGGDGRRLQSLTRSLTGDARPKQFCRFFGGATLLRDTRDRVFRNVEAERTLYVVTRPHQPFYREELPDVPAARLIEQPVSRGTTAAVAATLSRLRSLGVDGPIGFFPADHYYRDPDILERTVEAAYQLAVVCPDTIILLGAEATRAETEYGWIEPGALLPVQVAGEARARLREVRRFREKPSPQIALDLLKHACLWNTLVVIGQVAAFEALLTDAVPDIWLPFTGADAGRLDVQPEMLHVAYSMIRPSDFSHEVLAVCPQRLSVIHMPDAGWTDLGQPHRVLDVLAERREVLHSSHLAAG